VLGGDASGRRLAPAEAESAAETLGYPIISKRRKGGGGRRRCEVVMEPHELAASLESAQREAATAVRQ